MNWLSAAHVLWFNAGGVPIRKSRLMWGLLPGIPFDLAVFRRQEWRFLSNSREKQGAPALAHRLVCEVQRRVNGKFISRRTLRGPADR